MSKVQQILFSEFQVGIAVGLDCIMAIDRNRLRLRADFETATIKQAIAVTKIRPTVNCVDRI